MFQPLHILTQSELLANLQADIRDSDEDRWSDAELYRAINRSLRAWGNRVQVPFLYELGEWDSSVREYDLPDYVHPPVDPLYQCSGDDEWHEFKGYVVKPGEKTALRLVLAFFPPPSSARVVWWGRNSTVPATLPTISGSSITSTSTSVTVTGTADVADSGFIKAEQEWMQYSGRVRGATTTTLSNLKRGLFGTTAASHNTAVSVEWGVAVHNEGLYEQLTYQAIAFLHALFLTSASSTETEVHQFAMRYWQDRADQWWRGYRKARNPKMLLTREGVGNVAPQYADIYTRQGDWPWYR